MLIVPSATHRAVVSGAALSAVVILGLLALADAFAAPTTRLASVKSDGTQPAPQFPETRNPAISADGNIVAFVSHSAFTNDDEPYGTDVFVYNMATGVTARASVRDDGSHAGESYCPSISADGNLVAFGSDGVFTPGDRGSDPFGSDFDAFVRDMTTGKTIRASLRSDGSEVAGDVTCPQISPNGRLVAFTSHRHFTRGDDRFDEDVFVRNLVTQKTSRVSVRSDGTEVNGVSVSRASLSGDGHLVAFGSEGPFSQGDRNGRFDSFVRNRNTGRTTRVGLAGDNGFEPQLSANGRFVALLNRSVKTLPLGIYVRDRSFGTTDYVDGFYPSISGDGSYIAALDQLPDGDSEPSIYVYPRTGGPGTPVNVDSDGNVVPPNEATADYKISQDGRYVVFSSDRALVSTDTNDAPDIYLRGPLF